MKRTRRPASLRQEIVLGYTLVLLLSLAAFAGATYVLLRRTLANAGTVSLRQTAQTAEQLIVPAGIPRLGTLEQPIRGARGIEALRRRTRLATGEMVDIYVARTDDVERRALRSFTAIALLLIPLTALAAAAVGRTIANRILEPLGRLVRATREVRIGALDARMEEPPHPAELRDLACAFNAMIERIERAVLALRRFTADASHELRTPLTVIRGTAEVALARPDRSPDEMRATLAEIADEARTMLHLVEDLLALARGEEGRATPAAPLDLGTLLREVAATGEALAAGKPLHIEVDAPARLLMRGDAASLRRLFLNLVSNAVKFTERGRVRISARERAADRGLGREIEVRVADTGPGIEPELLPRVFDRFVRADSARAAHGGVGLGLAIARMIAEQHGGGIEVASTPGEGSAFTVRLPADGAEQPLRPDGDV